jgi:hypothetical protein
VLRGARAAVRETGGRQGGRPVLRRAENVWEDKDVAGIKRLEVTGGGIAWMTCMDCRSTGV